MHTIYAVLDSFTDLFSIPQALSCQEALFRRSLHSRAQVKENERQVEEKSIEELVTAIAAMTTPSGLRREGNTNLTIADTLQNQLAHLFYV
jgi:hypothetical protein